MSRTKRAARRRRRLAARQRTAATAGATAGPGGEDVEAPPRVDLSSTAILAGLGLAEWDYDAVQSRQRRQAPRRRLLAEDDHLDATGRRKMTATARDLARNYTLAAWMVKCHLSYVAQFKFRANNNNPTLDALLADSVTRWSTRQGFDARAKHHLARFLRIAEARRVLDGDTFWHKLSDGKTVGIEGDRIRQPTRAANLPLAVDLADVTHGVWQTKGLKIARGYALHNRTTGGGFEFARLLKARHVFAHGYYDRYDQTRGISPMAPAINTLRDCYETLTHAAVKQKIGQLFGLAIKWSEDREGSAGDVDTETDDAGDLDKSETTIDFGQAPYILDLLPDEEVTPIEAASAQSTEFVGFSKLLIMLSLRALGIPFSWFDESHTNYSGSRNAWLLYDRQADITRDENRQLLDAWLAWRIQVATLAGELALPKSVRVSDLRWTWQARAIPWIDPLKEARADDVAIKGGTQSTDRVCLARHGVSAYTIADEEAALRDYRRSKGLDQQPTNPAPEAPPPETE
jgi:capsid protein